MTERVTINGSGVITIPENLRQAYGLHADDELILETVAQGILLRPTTGIPFEDYSEERIAEFACEEEALGKLLPREN